ncbi:MAG: cytochrome C oxidase Cbb3, partial [Methylobacterium sp.]|nr:cytochrome C oxidase Cbb3 [Methylobacterium sp.]
MATANVVAGEQYNYDIVRKFTIMTLVWGAVGMLAGVWIASQLAYPFLNFDLPY